MKVVKTRQLDREPEFDAMVEEITNLVKRTVAVKHVNDFREWLKARQDAEMDLLRKTTGAPSYVAPARRDPVVIPTQSHCAHGPTLVISTRPHCIHSPPLQAISFGNHGMSLFSSSVPRLTTTGSHLTFPAGFCGATLLASAALHTISFTSCGRFLSAFRVAVTSSAGPGTRSLHQKLPVDLTLTPGPT